MSCSCRAVPWRTFVRGLAQVHRLDGASAARPALRPAALAPRGGGGGLQWAAAAAAVVLRQSRALHAATGLGAEEDGAAAAPQRVEDATGSPAEELAGAPAPPPPPPPSSPPAESDTHIARSARPSRSPTAEKKMKKKQQRQQQQQQQQQTDKPQRRGPRAETKQQQPYRPAPKARPDKPRSSSDAGSTTPAGHKPAERWRIQKEALEAKFPEGWKPRKRLSPDALAGIRALNAQFPEAYTTEALARKFHVSAEAIRRILRTQWVPSAAEEEERQERWFRRGKAVWAQKAALGVKPPKRWRMEGVTRDPGYHEWSRRASRREREWEEEEVRKYRESRERRQDDERPRGER